uniref:putative receptor-like protein kinase At5g39000 n=1 Tax=Erigeron canadensis TaxID=72917 RepID=UPI001CB90A4C|nr:putative receptor-like protein kinase At5g39000 [Erigeron canadensis]
MSNFMMKEFENLRIRFEVIRQVTNNFSPNNYLGKGGYGVVYRGEFIYSQGPSTMVAIKRNLTLGQGEIEFWREIMMLSCYKHENLVSLLGFCDENGERILVYNYAPNKSLDQHLHNTNISWIQRLKICIGAARGLEYLHNPRGTQQRILHRDIKSSNILLDENWNAQIADFGLSKYGPANQAYTFVISNISGTPGYCDPMYVETMLLTKESDVYSFGVVLLEVLCSRPVIEESYKDDRRVLTQLAKKYYAQQKLHTIINDTLRQQMVQPSFDTFAAIAYQCVQRDPKDRPPMALVVSQLETALGFHEVRNVIPRNVNFASSSSEPSSTPSDIPQPPKTYVQANNQNPQGRKRLAQPSPALRLGRGR